MRKRERDLRSLHIEDAERPNHPFTLFNLGMTYYDARDHIKAERYLMRSVDHSNPTDSHLRKVYSLLVYSRLCLCRTLEAEETCRTGLELYPLDDELRFRLAVILQESARFTDALIVYEDILARREERHFASVDPGIRGSKTHQNLAVLYRMTGDHESAERHLRLTDL